MSGDTLISRRHVLNAAGASVLALVLPGHASNTTAPRTFRLRAGPSDVSLVSGGKTRVWSYNGSVPGPAIRARQGERIRIMVANGLDEPTTVHWHGIRLANAMDGVPFVTQKPIAPGGEFSYEFPSPDAGTFMYHSHQRGDVQIPMGLFGPLIVEESGPVAVDRDVTWLLSDWRLDRDGQISRDFGSMIDVGMAGRLGNVVTVNGRVPGAWTVRAGERVRLRMVNMASARFFSLSFGRHRPSVIAYDGQPVEPHEPQGGRLILGPGMRADVVVDMTGEPGSTHAVWDSFYEGEPYRVATFAYAKEKAPAGHAGAATLRLPANRLAEPMIEKAARHLIAFGGGMGMGGMGGMMGMPGRHGMMGGRMGMMGGAMWSINGVSATGPDLAPLFTFARGKSYVLTLRNDTNWLHTVHLHGHSFREVARNGAAVAHRPWRDTVLIAPQENVEVAFVADNPGDWMIHCHILDHQEAGMMGVIRVS
jgi:FtsP/CotA-like multicopper oxidase with cupredoxin domain